MTLKEFLWKFTGQTKVYIACRGQELYRGSVAEWCSNKVEEQGDLELMAAEVYDLAELDVIVK